MYEQSPHFFMKYRKDFRYYIYFEEPRLGIDFEDDVCYAYGLHSKKNEYCSIKERHFHVLLGTSKIQHQRDGFAIPCLYTTFALLLRTTSDLQIQGETMERLNQAMGYKSCGFAKSWRNRIPIIQARKDATTQTNDLSPILLNRVQSILTGSYAASFYKVIDIFVDGFGSIDNEAITFSFDSSAN